MSATCDVRLIAYAVIACVALAALRVTVLLGVVILVLAIVRALILWPRETLALLVAGCVLSAVSANPLLFSVTFAAFAGIGAISLGK